MKTEQTNGNGKHGIQQPDGCEPQNGGTRSAPVWQAAAEGVRSKYVWMDGDLVPFEQATVHFLTPTLHYGTGIFEGIRCYETAFGPAVFRLAEHLKRFEDSARIAGIDALPFTREELRAAVHCVVRANGFTSCYIRPLIFMAGGMGLNLDAWQPVVGIAAWEWGPFLGEAARETGVRLMVSSFTRHHPNVMMTKAKIAGNYVNSTLAKTLAARAGFDETVMLDPEGYVAECSGENLFLVRNGTIYTPGGATILEGITRSALLTLAADRGIPVVEGPVSRDQLYIADEVFLCGTAAEVVPVREIDYRKIGGGQKGPVTAALQAGFFEAVEGRGRRSADWLDYVDETVLAV